MSAKIFLVGIVANVLIAGIAMVFLSLSRERVVSVAGRVKATASLGVLSWIVAHVPYWNWFHFPFDYTIVYLFDIVIGFGLMGLVISKFVPE